MRIFETIPPLKSCLIQEKSSQKKIGLVPTMGALHEGHLALLHESLRDNDITVCSIYVNPTQFNNPDDLVKYPRNLEADLPLLERVGCPLVFCPGDAEMYPGGKDNSLKIDLGYINQVLEGAHRPGHFSGVGVVLSKLFHIVGPDRVYFGQKDLQQVAIVRKLIRDLFFDLQLLRVSTVRNDKGLAFSSRNTRLSEEEKITATKLYQALNRVKLVLSAQPDAVHKARRNAVAFLKEENKIKVEYLEIVDADSFGMVSDIRDHQEVAVCVAAYIGEVRLIDNILL